MCRGRSVGCKGSRSEACRPTKLTVKGVPNRDSAPNVSSGKDTPISEMAVCADDMPGEGGRKGGRVGGW